MSADILRQLRDRLTIEEAAEEFSKALAEPVSSADVLRLALDGELRLALYLPMKVTARCQRVNDDSLDPVRRHRVIEGLCDIPMEGRAKAEIDHRYHWLAEQHYVPREGRLEGASVEQDGYLCQLPPDHGQTGMWTRSASEFPQGSVLCVRRTALDELLRGVEAKKRPADSGHDGEDKPLDERERETLSMMVAALAKEAGVDLAQPYKAAETIVSVLEGMGYKRSSGAIASHLNRISKQFPIRQGKK